MTTQPRKLVPAVALVFALSVLLSPGIPAGEKSGARLEVTGHSSDANIVVVAVSNLSADSGSGLVEVTAVVQGAPIRSSQSVTVTAGQTVYVPVSFSGMVSGVICAGITDGADPVQ